jgi:hypothetical protein
MVSTKAPPPRNVVAVSALWELNTLGGNLPTGPYANVPHSTFTDGVAHA